MLSRIGSKFEQVQCKSNVKAMQVQFIPVKIGLALNVRLFHNAFDKTTTQLYYW